MNPHSVQFIVISNYDMELNAYTPETMIEASPGGKIDMTKVSEYMR